MNVWLVDGHGASKVLLWHELALLVVGTRRLGSMLKKVRESECLMGRDGMIYPLEEIKYLG
jgi:hypothetical protein